MSFGGPGGVAPPGAQGATSPGDPPTQRPNHPRRDSEHEGSPGIGIEPSSEVPAEWEWQPWQERCSETTTEHGLGA